MKAKRRELVNRRYRRWSPAGKRRFHRYFAKSFTSGASRIEPGAWPVEFAGRTISMPLRPDRMWLDWDNALSIVGHDIEVKQTYAASLRSANPPTVFVDVGANYGLHSILFLSHGVEAITFEPNPACHEDFRVICESNGLTGRIEGVALGGHQGEVQLIYPERETWLGTVSSGSRPEPEGEAGSSDGFHSQQVQQRTLDDYLGDLVDRRVLIKVDTEGSEHEVLAGAVRTLETVRPPIIFESLPDADRHALYGLLESCGYGVVPLPWDPGRPSSFLSERVFVASTAENFAAVPPLGDVNP